MNIIIIVVAVTAGVILGGTAIYVYQGKCRQKELKLLAECMEKILREEKIRETKSRRRDIICKTRIQTGKDPGNVKWTDRSCGEE